MKNFKLTLWECLVERLVNLASLEENRQFQDVYLNTLQQSVNARDQLRRVQNSRTCSFSCALPCQPHSRCAQ